MKLPLPSDIKEDISEFKDELIAIRRLLEQLLALEQEKQ